MTTDLENPLALRAPAELVLPKTALVQRGLELADLALARLAGLAVAVQTLPVWRQIDIEMITIPAGPFLMGSDKSKDADAKPYECPQHVVSLPAFCIARVPVTNEQYEKFVEATRHPAPYGWNQGRIPIGEEAYPVEVDWYEALAFCRWAGVRLPTEAEWEKAARGTDGRIFPWGDEPLPYELDGELGGYAPVGNYPERASPYGVLDMVVGAAEWTSSLWGFNWKEPDFGYPYDPNDGRENLDAVHVVCRVLRGTSCSDRAPLEPLRLIPYGDEIEGRVGFRVVLLSSST